ncbi:ABC transporter ATP-binding protein [bacterium]|nr:ABC transporter ATP-binding protein [bacterium]
MGIVVRDIYKRFGGFIAVDGVSFDVREGELVALLGPSGSGKSTILRIIAGLEIPDRGEIYLKRENVTALSPRQRKVGFVFQHYALFKHMTVEKNIAFGLEVQKRKRKDIEEKVRELIRLVKLEGYEGHYPSQLSGGQRQRVALARTLATEPSVLLLDEPFGALDAKVRDNLAKWLKELHVKLNITSVFVTHDQNEAIEISDKIVVINRGKVEQIGTAKDVYEHPNSKFVASFIGNVNVVDAVIKNGLIFIKDTDFEIIDRDIDVSVDRDIVLLVRPEDILVEKDSKQEGFPCMIQDVHYRGSFYEFNLCMGDTYIRSVKDKDDFLGKKWEKNQKAFVVFKQYKIFDASEGHWEIREKLRQLGYIE